MTRERERIWITYNEVFGPLEKVQEPEAPITPKLTKEEREEILTRALASMSKVGFA